MIWRHRNGATWRALPAERGPWWTAASALPAVPGAARPGLFIRWGKLEVWERLLSLAQERGVQLGMAFLDGTTIRAHQKAAGALKRGDLHEAEMSVKPVQRGYDVPRKTSDIPLP